MSGSKRMGLIRALAALTLVHCSPQPLPSLYLAEPSANSLLATNGATYELFDLVSRHKWTVFVFFSDTCPTVKAHDERVKALAKQYAPLGVGVYMIDSERGGSVWRAQRAVAARGYPFPLLVDPEAKVAATLGARYASHTVILDSRGKPAYSGALDSDKRFLHADVIPYVNNALDALISGAQAPPGDHRALGCALQR